MSVQFKSIYMVLFSNLVPQFKLFILYESKKDSRDQESIQSSTTNQTSLFNSKSIIWFDIQKHGTHLYGLVIKYSFLI